MTDPGMCVIYGYLALVSGTWTYVRIRSRWRDRQNHQISDTATDGIQQIEDYLRKEAER